MATEETTADKPAEQDADEQVKKTVTINGYAKPGEYEDSDEGRRRFADALDEDTDFFDRRSRDRTTRYAVLDELKIDLCWDVYEDLKEKVDAGFDIGDARLTVEEETTSEYRYRVQEAGRNLADSFGRSIDCPEGLAPHSYNEHVWVDDDEWIVVIRSRKPKLRQVLAHHDRRTRKHRFESDEPVMSFQWNVELGPATEDFIDLWSEQVTGPFADYVARNTAINKVRIADCKERVEREGDCFNV